MRLIPLTPAYLDTNVILDVIDKRNQDSIDILDYFKNNHEKCHSSHFAIMEALAIKQENKYIWDEFKKKKRIDKIIHDRKKRELPTRDLIDEYNNIVYEFMKPYNEIMSYFYLTPEGWRSSIVLMTQMNISASDAIHVQLAYSSNSQSIISSDSELTKRSQKIVPSYPPKQFLKLLRRENKEV